MRLWVVNHYALPPDAAGGPTRHLGMAKALTRRGHDVVVHASVYDHYTRADHRPRGTRLHTIEDIDGVTYVWWATPPYQSTPERVRNMVSFARKVSRHGPRLQLPRPDVVLGSSPHLLAAWAARRLARRFGVPFFFEVRDLWPQTFVDMGELGQHHPAVLVLRRLERSLYRTADRVISVLPHAGRYISEHGGAPERTIHIPNGVELIQRPASRPTSDQPFTVVYAGTLGYANNLEVAVDAAAELVRRGRLDLRIRLVGAGPERDRLREFAQRDAAAILSVEDPVPASAVPALLSTADACLLMLRPSKVFQWGISPTKLFDYLAAGRPVIASVSGPDDIVGPAGAGIWSNAGDPMALADAIERVAAMTAAERTAMGNRGRRYVEAHHGFERLADLLLDALEECRTSRMAVR